MSLLLPEDVYVSEADGTETPADLFPEESASISRAAPRRVQEFTAGRVCAHNALTLLGLGKTPISVGSSREPLWPKGVVGSITHCPGYCAAAVASGRRWLGVGIDAEPNSPLPDGVLRVVGLPEEFIALEQLPRNGTHWDRLLFSAKESTYKAWWPVTRVWLGFEDARVTFFPESNAFEVCLKKRHKRLPADRWTGRYLVRDDVLLTAITLPLPPGPGGPTSDEPYNA